jgi:hypothetical protein
LGCKYIALLELLTDLEDYLESQGLLANFQVKQVGGALGDCIGDEQCQEIWQKLQEVDLTAISLKNQPSLLMAPAITGIESAIPVKALADFVVRLGLDVQPTVKETHCLIKGSRLFNLIDLLAFGDDDIARETVVWLRANLPAAPKAFVQLPGRTHLAPLGWRNGDSHLADEVIAMLDALKQRITSFASP